MMNKTEFLNYEAERLCELLDAEYSGEVEVRNVTVVKVNDQKLHGLSISLDGSNACPTVYLDEAYEAYKHGESPDYIAMQLAAGAGEAVAKTPEMIVSSEMPDLKDKPIGLRLLEASRNREFLKDTPYMEVGNGLVLICDVRVQENEGGRFATVVNNNVLELMGKDRIEVFRQALSESWDNDKPVLCSLEAKMFGEEVNFLEGPGNAEANMYVLSNRSGIHGAAALYYPDVQRRVAEVLGGDYYALPSSTEEFIIVPEDCGLDPEAFTVMVKEANENVVSPEQVLSDSVFKYDRETDTLFDVTAGRELSSRSAEMRC